MTQDRLDLAGVATPARPIVRTEVPVLANGLVPALAAFAMASVGDLEGLTDHELAHVLGVERFGATALRHHLSWPIQVPPLVDVKTVPSGWSKLRDKQLVHCVTNRGAATYHHLGAEFAGEGTVLTRVAALAAQLPSE